MNGNSLTKFSDRNCEDMGVNIECKTFSLSGDLTVTHSIKGQENFIEFSISRGTEIQVFRKKDNINVRFLGEQNIDDSEDGIVKIISGENTIQVGENCAINDDFVSIPSGLFFTLLNEKGVTLTQSSLAGVGDGVTQDVNWVLT